MDEQRIYPIEQKIYLDKLFPRINNVNIQNLKIDHESVSYITVPTESRKTVEIICKHITKHKPAKDTFIVDVTAGVGGDTISFCNTFGSVVSIEIDESRFEKLVNNIEQYGFKNCVPMNGNSIAILPKLLYADVIYIDAPWTDAYKTSKSLRLSLGDVELETIVLDCFNKEIIPSQPKIVALKMPKNYDIKYFFERVSPELDIYLYNLRKINILIVERKVKEVSIS